MRRNRQRNKKKTFMILSLVFICLFMGVGFSYFSEIITFEGTANLYASRDYLWYELLNTIQPSSLQAVSYENGKYAFVGNNPDNYVQFQGDTIQYRIVSIESDHTIKLMLPAALTTEFDSVGNRTNDSTYCTDLTHGCNSWTTQSSLTNGTISGSVENDSTILQTMSSTFGTFSSNSPFIEHQYNIGPVSSGSTLAQVAQQEQQKTWIGQYGILSLSDILFAESGNSNATLGTAYDSYLFNVQGANLNNMWTMSPLANDSSKVWVATPSKTQEAIYASEATEVVSGDTKYNYFVVVVYIKSNVKLDSGTGTQADPYILTYNAS